MALFRIVASIEAMAAGAIAADEQFLRTPSLPDWKLLHRVDPEYPAAALRHRIQDAVRFECRIGTNGHIERLRLIGGHPLLVPAAREAARQWIYEPAFLHNRPVRVITLIEVQFQLDPYGNSLIVPLARAILGLTPKPPT